MNDGVTLQSEVETAEMNSEEPARLNSEKNGGLSSVTCFNFLLKALYLLLDLQKVPLPT